MNDIVNIISSVGFPIFAFLICAYGLKYAYDTSLKQNEKSIEEIGELTKAVNNNTIVLTELVKEIHHNEKKGENNEVL